MVKKKNTVGNGLENDIVISDPTVSRQHALIRRRFRRYWLIDLESTNGTTVNRRPVKNPTPLERGDELRFGAARFVFLKSPDTRELTRRFSLSRVLAAMLALFVTMFALTEFFINRSLLQKLAFPSSGSTDVSSRPLIEGATGSPAASADKPGLGGPVPAKAASVSADSEPDWLRELNRWRASAGVPLVDADPDEIRGATSHARYIVKNYLAGNPETPHHEEPSNPWYTPEGGKVAPIGDEAEEYGPGIGTVTSPMHDVDGWVDGAFHRLGLLARNLTAASYGSYCENNACASVLVQASRQDSNADTMWYGKFPEPVMFPSNGSTLTGAQTTLISGEWPEPLSLSCAGYNQPVGYPITLQFDSRFVPKLLSYGLTQNDVAVPVCGYASDSYTNSDGATQEWGRRGLKGNGAIVLIPREPLKLGAVYTVTVNVQGEDDPFGWGPKSTFAGQMRSYTWSFSVAP
ncbi:MAG TPA: FHA domain-containing protein [Candidatus Binataceae bacterium]